MINSIRLAQTYHSLVNKELMQIHEQYSNQVSTQSYAPTPVIAGVFIKELPFFSDDGGNFAELFRLSTGTVDQLDPAFTVQQVSFSVMTPGTIKAYHLHYRQEDLWFCSPFDRLLVNLHDVRQNSESYDVHMRLVLGAGKHKVLRIPAGVAHGVANIYDRPMTLTYATSEKFSPENPDEHRLPWDAFGADVWELTRG